MWLLATILDSTYLYNNLWFLAINSSGNPLLLVALFLPPHSLKSPS